MDVDDDNAAAPMLVEPRPAEDHRLQPMSDEFDGDGAPSTEDGVLLLPRGLFDALDDDDAAADFPWTSSFVLFFPSSTSRRTGRPVGSTPLRVRTVFFEAVMFPLHCLPPHRPLTYPACRFLFPPALIRSSQSTRDK